MENKKYKILVVPSDRSGVGAYRSINPHLKLEELYPNEFHVDIDFNPNFNDDEWLKQYDLVHYHRTLGDYDLNESKMKKLDTLGIKSVMDIDDYWSPGEHHPAYKLIKANGLNYKILENIKNARNITTTTNIFKNKIKKYNKDVLVIPNAIDPNDKQFKSVKTKSDRLRIGWLGGSSHLKDLELLKDLVSKLKGENLLDKVQLVLCGFDISGTRPVYDKISGKVVDRQIKPTESVWYKYEQIFTDNYTTISDDYRKHLIKYRDEPYDTTNEAYSRVWTKPVNTYANNYNLFDVSLAPLVENIFNDVKSQLKVIEAGFHKKALIAQDFGPYQIDLINLYSKGEGKKDDMVINKNGNALLVNSRKNHKDWFRNIKRLLNEPELVTKLGDNLYETVKDTYDINNVTKIRYDYYLSILTKK